MKVLKVETINLPDNDNRPPNVIPMPMKAYDGTLSFDQSEALHEMFDDPEAFNEREE